MTAAPAPLTCEEEAAKLCPCSDLAACSLDGTLHSRRCPVSLIPAVAAALRARQMAGRREAKEAIHNPELFRHYADGPLALRGGFVNAIAALPEVP